MKKINYDKLNLKGNEQVFHMWEPLKFEITDNYQYVNNNIIFKTISNILFCIIVPILFTLNKVLFGLKIEGKENMKEVRGGKVTISNHVHPMDCTMNGLVNFPHRMYFLSLANNFKIPFIRHLIRILYAIPIPKKQSQKETFYKEIKQAIQSGKTLHIYPEASLWPYYEKIREFKKGAFKIAVEVNCPIVPILYQFKEPKGIYKLYKRKKCIHAKILKPIYPDMSLDEVSRAEKLKNQARSVLEKG